MQINKINSTPNFGAKLNLAGAGKKHWNLSDTEIKSLTEKAREIGHNKDTITLNIGKFEKFDHRDAIKNQQEFNDNVGFAALYGSSRKISADYIINGKAESQEIADYVAGSSDKLEKPYRLLFGWLSKAADILPNKLHKERKIQSTESLKSLLDNYKENVKNVSDYLFKGADSKKVSEHLYNVKKLSDANNAYMIDRNALDLAYTNKLHQVGLEGFRVEPYTEELISRAHVNSAEEYLNVRRKPSEFAELQKREQTLLNMAEDLNK